MWNWGSYPEPQSPKLGVNEYTDNIAWHLTLSTSAATRRYTARTAFHYALGPKQLAIAR
jgi:hypothetical protein